MTAIPEAKLALLAMLQARGELAGVQIQAGLPAEVPTSLERFYIDAARPEGLDEALQEDETPSVERFAMMVVIETRQITGADPGGYAVAEARKWVLYRLLEATVAKDPQLGVAVWSSYVLVQAEVTRPTEDGWFGQVLALVRCRNTT